MSATVSPRPAPWSAPVTWSISRIPGPPFGPSQRITITSLGLIFPALTAWNESSSRSRAAFGGLGHDVADHEPVSRPGEPSIGHERNRVAKAGALERARHVEHLAHPRPSLRALPADHDHVVGLDLPGLDGLERVLFPISRRLRRPRARCGRS